MLDHEPTGEAQPPARNVNEDTDDAHERIVDEGTTAHGRADARRDARGNGPVGPPLSAGGGPSPTVLFMPPEETAAAGAAPAAGAGGSAASGRGSGAGDRAGQAADPGPSSGAGASSDAGGAAGPDASAGDEEHTESAGASSRSRRRGRRGRGRGKGPQDAADDQQNGRAEPEDDSSEQAALAQEGPPGAPASVQEGSAGAPASAQEGAAGEPAPVEPAEAPADGGEAADTTGDAEGDTAVTRRRRRRRRRKGGADGADAAEAQSTAEEDVDTVVKVREPRAAPTDEVRGVTGSTRLEAKRQRRRGGRDQRRSRPTVLSESEFLARREAVDRVMVIRQQAPGQPTQIGVLEDGILVEHYVSRAHSHSMVGSVYLGKVQNVLPSMEAAFVDVGRGRNAVLYAGEVNWDASGLAGKSRSIEQALSSGDSVLVQVTKDPVGHKGARLTSNIALSGRHLVYTPNGNASGISRKLPENERRRLRDSLKSLVPEGAGVIVRTAAESASGDDLARDVKRLQAQWEDIQQKAAKGSAPTLLYSEPDMVVRVVRDLFNEDFRELVIEGDEAYATVEAYLSHVSPDLVPRLRRHQGTKEAFAAHRVDEQILKGLDRKVYLPSGGHLVFDRTEAMTVIDVNTGKYTGTGGNLEETVTRNNLEAAEEIVRQLRLRDIGGIIVIDFIDMVLESNRELVLRRLTECLSRDRTKHQVTEITSLGLVQMTRKRVGAGLLEAFSEQCDCCKGRGVVVHTEPVGEKPRGNGGTGQDRAAGQDKTSQDRPHQDKNGQNKNSQDKNGQEKASQDKGRNTGEKARSSSGRRSRRRQTSSASGDGTDKASAADSSGGSGSSGAGSSGTAGSAGSAGAARGSGAGASRAGPAADGTGTDGTAAGGGGSPSGESGAVRMSGTGAADRYASTDDPDVQEIGISGVLRRFRRRGGRHRM